MNVGPGGGTAITVALRNSAAEATEREGGRFRATFPVRWSDCDPAGILYYPNYYSFQECAMVEFFRSRGHSWKTLGDRFGVHFPRLESHCRYMASATFEDLVEVELSVPEIARKVVTVAFSMFRQRDGVQLCEGRVKFAMVPFVGPNGGPPRALELPDEVRMLFVDLR